MIIVVVVFIKMGESVYLDRLDLQVLYTLVIWDVKNMESFDISISVPFGCISVKNIMSVVRRACYNAIMSVVSMI